MSGERLRSFVRWHAADRFEYCRLSQEHCLTRLQIEHIVARQHGGTSAEDNLALTCASCNLRKGPNLTGIDPIGGDVVLLFHPRTDVWLDHFRTEDCIVHGLTSAGRATVRLLRLNASHRVELRRAISALDECF